MTDELIAALRRIPRFRAVAPNEIQVERLGGLTNQNWKIDWNGEAFVLRIAGAGTGDYIDRSNESVNARAASEAKVGAEVIFADEASGLMMTRFVPGAVTMTPALFKSRQGAPARAALALKRMHDSGLRFAKRFELFAMIDSYRAHLAKLGAGLPEGYEAAVEQAGTVRQALLAAPAELVPCHCDPLSENFLDTGERMWVVDWEYSGMNDRWWDLGDLAVEADFDAAQERELLEAYCDGPPSAAAVGRTVIYKAMCDLLWTLWGLIQHANENPVEDFWAYALKRFERCRALMADPDFPRHLAAIRAG